MLIHEMTRKESLELLARKRLGRLACAREGQPYITPIFFAHDKEALYSFSTVGQKIEWMRANPLVCVETDEIENQHNWATVIAFGRYEELLKTAEYENDRQLAHALLDQQPLWWQPGYVRTIVGGKERPLELVYFRIHIHRVSGHRAVPD